LSENPVAIDYLRTHPDLVSEFALTTNPAITIEEMSILERSHNACTKDNPVYWDYVVANNLPRWCAYSSASTNPRMLAELAKLPNDIDWFKLSMNPAAMFILKKHPDKIRWDGLSSNPNDEAVDLLLANEEKINKLNLSANYNLRVKPLILKYIDQVNKVALTCNPMMFDFLECHREFIDWRFILRNPHIFVDVPVDDVKRLIMDIPQF